MKRRYLFYLVHPAKFHFHKVQIKKLKEMGCKVDILINSKDILENLLKESGWDYINIFPKSRRNKNLPVKIGAAIAIFKTMFRLLKITKGKKYDLFIGDLLTWLGIIKNTPSLFPCDDTLDQVPEQFIFYKASNYIISPNILDNYSYNNKTIKYFGYKALAHLHPNHFTPDIKKLFKDLQNKSDYFLIRCTGFNATHDINKKGINNETLTKIIKILKPYGKILISSERDIPNKFQKYSININKNDISHYINFSKIFISDSTTMSTEAAVLGTPSIEFDEYFYEIDQMVELENKYKLIHCFRTSQEEEMLNKIKELIQNKNLKNIYEERRKIFLNESIDVSSFLVWLYENFPKSKDEYFNDINIQNKFK